MGVATLGLWLTDLPSRTPALGVETGQRLAPTVEKGDRVVVVGLWQLEVRHGLASADRVSGPDAATIVAVETLPKSQVGHPGWLDREALYSSALENDARALEEDCRDEGSRVWLVRSPSLAVLRCALPAFAGWQCATVAPHPLLAIDLLQPPKVRGF